LSANFTIMKLTGCIILIMFSGYSFSQCNVEIKEYSSSGFSSKITGSWQAVEWYVHDENLLGDRIFNFIFSSNDSLTIEEPGAFLSKGSWVIGEEDNSLIWEMPDKNNSFSGRYDIVDGQLILEGKGLIGEDESVCIILKKMNETSAGSQFRQSCENLSKSCKRHMNHRGGFCWA